MARSRIMVDRDFGLSGSGFGVRAFGFGPFFYSCFIPAFFNNPNNCFLFPLFSRFIFSAILTLVFNAGKNAG